MGCSKSSSKREVYCNTILPQETRKTLNRQPNFTPQTTGKRRTKTPKISRRKEIIKIREEITEKEKKQTIRSVQLLGHVLLSVTPMNRSTPGSPVHHQLPESTQTHVLGVSDAIQPSHPVIPFSHLQSFPASGSFPMSQLFASGGQSIGVSASTSVLPMNTQD